MKKIIQFTIISVIIILILGIPLAFYAISSLKNSEAYKFSKSYIYSSEELNSKIGGVKKIGWMVGGEVLKESGIEQNAKFKFIVYGKNGSKDLVTIHISHLKNEWKVDTLFHND